MDDIIRQAEELAKHLKDFVDARTSHKFLYGKVSRGRQALDRWEVLKARLGICMNG